LNAAGQERSSSVHKTRGDSVLCQDFALELNLDTSTEAQDALRIMDDRSLPWRLLTGCQNGLEETRFGGFFVAFIILTDCSQSVG
jgi:hypothetical protein